MPIPVDLCCVMPAKKEKAHTSIYTDNFSVGLHLRDNHRRFNSTNKPTLSCVCVYIYIYTRKSLQLRSRETDRQTDRQTDKEIKGVKDIYIR